jgi:hypothetical protein
MSRITISSLDHFIRLLNKNPSLMALGSLSPLVRVSQEAKEEGKKCGCNIARVYAKHKGTFELALNNLGHGDHLIAKRVLGVDQICYYNKEKDGLKLKCL